MSVFHRRTGLRKASDCAAVFVHAGAGYHSIQNESIHLQACNDAAMAAMAILRNGGTAVEAVEIAIKVLEDREITNAGYGSNLAIDGAVEGDAVVVDHLGRSGGVGAVAQIKNPISLARLILDQSTQELTLRRVPPNLLVGQGATDFAYDQGLPILPNDALVSPAARDRWYRWKQDLKAAEKKVRDNRRSGSDRPTSNAHDDPPPGYEERVKSTIKREHVKALQASVWNEGQPVSPLPQAGAVRPVSAMSTTPSRPSSVALRNTPETSHTPLTEDETFSPPGAPLTAENLAQSPRFNASATSFSDLRTATDAQDATRDNDDSLSGFMDATEGVQDVSMSDIDDSDEATSSRQPFLSGAETAWHDGASSGGSSNSSLRLPSLTPSPPRVVEAVSTHVSAEQTSEQDVAHDILMSTISGGSNTQSVPPAYSPDDSGPTNRLDCITDTVGAIAIDSEGNIACGASSGGIGMKFRGRIGPAALVGVGAAVVPVDAEDKSGTCTGAVTSGTGEHMGTTLAASVCAERLYHGQKKRKGGGYEHCEDDQAIRSMIENDFMAHPSVRNSHSTGAIGVLAVKKTTYGAYLYFAHNTDSFALASMHAEEPKPTCTMSRSHGNGMVAAGGRAIRYKRKW